MSRSFSAIVLIGMSGVGKTTNAEKYGEKTTRDEARQKIHKNGHFLCISADNEIFFRLKDKGELSDADHSKDPIDLLAGYVGKFGAEKNGGFARDKFLERQKLYSQAELDDLEALPVLLESAYRKQPPLPPLPQPILYDTTGSFCEVLKSKQNPLYQKIVSQAVIVYLECSDEEEKILLKRQLEQPKPMVYDRGCFDRWLEEYKEQQSQMEEEIDPNSFLRFVFPKAIEYRRARYEGLANVTLTTAELERLIPPVASSAEKFPERFLALVESKLQRVPSTQQP